MATVKRERRLQLLIIRHAAVIAEEVKGKHLVRQAQRHCSRVQNTRARLREVLVSYFLGAGRERVALIQRAHPLLLLPAPHVGAQYLG